jgi:hypothetical protein
VCDDPEQQLHRVHKVRHLLMHALEMLSRLVLLPLPLRRLLDDLVLRGIRCDRGHV